MFGLKCRKNRKIKLNIERGVIMTKKLVLIVATDPVQACFYLPKRFKEQFPNDKLVVIVPEGIKKYANFNLLDDFSETILIETESLTTIGYYFDAKVIRAAIEKAIVGYAKEDVYLHCPDELNMERVAVAIEGLGLSRWSVEKAYLFRNKTTMKEHLSKFNIRIPKYKKLEPTDKYEDLAKSFDVPFVVKPVDSAASFGFLKVTNQEEFDEYMKEADFNANEYGVEEFITGKLYHVDCVVYNGKMIAALPHVYTIPLAEYKLSKPIASLWMHKDEFPEEVANLMKFNEEVIAAFDTDGVFHQEMFINDKGEAIFLEIACRQAGFPGNEGFWQVNDTTQSYLFMERELTKNDTPIQDYNENKHRYTEMFLYVPRKEGVLKFFELPPLKSTMKMIPLAKENDSFKVATAYNQLGFKAWLVGDYDSILHDFKALSDRSDVIVVGPAKKEEPKKD